MQSILKELKFITNRMKMRDEEEDIIMDWKGRGHLVDVLPAMPIIIFSVLILSEYPD